MRTVIRSVVAASWMLALAAGPASAEGEKAAPPAAGSEQAAARQALQKLGSPGEAHRALEPLVGMWTYTAAWWTSPDAEPQAMTGLAVNSLIFGGRFLKQEIRGDAEGLPPFEGLGFTGYDNIRKEYTSIWFDSMATGIMTGAGQFDAATQTLTTQSDVSCPITGEAHRTSRETWKIVDQNRATYESYARSPEGKEFKSLEIHYTRAAPGA